MLHQPHLDYEDAVHYMHKQFMGAREEVDLQLVCLKENGDRDGVQPPILATVTLNEIN